MNEDREDPLLDGCLAELLGGAAPPDFTARIMRAWKNQQHTRSIHGAVPVAEATNGAVSLSPAPPPIISPPVIATSTAESNGTAVVLHAPLALASRPHRGRSGRNRTWLLNLAISGGVLAIVATVGSIGYLLGLRTATSNPSVAKTADEKRGPNSAGTKSPSGVPKEQVVQGPSKSADDTPGKLPESIAKPDAAPSETNPPAPNIAKQDPASPNKPADVSPALPAANVAVTGAPASDAEMIAFINDQLAAAWKVAGVKPAEKASDEEWCRRVFLRIVGRIPTIDELQKFARDKSPDKRATLVDALLAKDGYLEESARYFSTVWTNALIGRSMRAKDDLAIREGLQHYLRLQIAQNKPFDRWVRDLLTATGSNDPDAPDYNPAVNFLLASNGEKATLATARTSRLFLGMQLQCVQCHNHPFNGLTQNQFWELSAYFRQMKQEPASKAGFARLVNVDFRGEGEGRADEAELYYEQRNGQLKVAYPVFIDGTTASHSGTVAKNDRRAELARLITASDNLSQAFVNRMWANFLGFGFTRPVDDLGPHNPPSHPELMQRLAREVRLHNYDQRALVRWIVLSDAFGASSRIGPGNKIDDPVAGNKPLFARYYTRQLQAEEVFQSLQVALARPSSPAIVAGQEQARQLWLGQFARNMNTDEGDEFHVFNGSIPQSLAMMNGELTQRATSGEPGSLLDQIVTAKLTPAEKATHLFQAAIARKPTDKELRAIEALLKARGNDQAAAFGDIWWALLNSNEFILDH